MSAMPGFRKQATLRREKQPRLVRTAVLPQHHCCPILENPHNLTDVTIKILHVLFALRHVHRDLPWTHGNNHMKTDSTDLSIKRVDVNPPFNQLAQALLPRNQGHDCDSGPNALRAVVRPEDDSGCV